MTAYSFLDVSATLTGPGGSIELGNGAEVAEEGISIEATNDKNTMTEGADGSVMHNLRASTSGTITVRLLKTSPANKKLQTMFNYQSQSSSRWGRNVIIIRDTARGDMITCEKVSFKRDPNKTYAVEGGVIEWQFDGGRVVPILGDE